MFDRRFLEGIAHAAGVTKGDLVLEIGPGAGALTEVLCQKGARVVAVEIDGELLPLLRENPLLSGVTFIHADFLTLDLISFYEKNLAPGFKVVANLPYYAATNMIVGLLESGLPFYSITALLQKEVAARLAARPGQPDYGSLSCLAQYHTAVKLGLKIPPGAFVPPPKIESQVAVLTRLLKPAVAADPAYLFPVIRAAFAMRRKTLCNNLMAAFSLPRTAAEKLLSDCGLPAAVRGEELGLQQFACLAEALAKTQG